MEPGTILLLNMFFIITQFLQLYLCNMDKICNGSGNHESVNFMLSITTLEIQPTAVVKDRVVRLVFHLVKLGTQ